MRLILPLLFLTLSPAFAAEKLAVKMPDGKMASVSLVEAGETARLRLEVPGEPPVTSEVLGEEFQEFEAGGGITLLAAEDLDGDGTPEIFVRTTLPPRSGSFFAFKVEAKSLKAIKFGGDDSLDVSHGGDVILKKGQVEFDDPAGGKHPARRTVRFTGQAFTPLLR
jgi:hypothetical protein